MNTTSFASNRMFRILIALALSASAAAVAVAQPYTLTPEQWLKIQQHNAKFFPGYGKWPAKPVVFHIARVDQQFLPAKKDASLPVDVLNSARQSFVASLSDGKIVALNLFLRQNQGPSLGFQLDAELYEGQTYNSIAPKMTLLASATSYATFPSALPNSQRVNFKLNQPVPTWQNRRFVIVLSTPYAPPGVIDWVGDSGNPYANGQSAKGAFGVVPPNDVDLGFRVINLK